MNRFKFNKDIQDPENHLSMRIYGMDKTSVPILGGETTVFKLSKLFNNSPFLD